jgi:hypothetical protein
MSTRSARLILWLGLALMAPVPVLTGVVTGLMPVARILMLSGVCGLVVLLESSNGVVGVFGAMLFAQAVLYLILFFGVAHFVSLLIGRLPRKILAASVLAFVTASVVWTASSDVYRTPFRAASTRANLFEIFE